MPYTYTGTPTQRIEQAQNRIAGNNPMISSYLAAAKQPQLKVVAQPKEPDKWYDRLGDTLGMAAKDVFTGFTKAFEGLADFGASTVGVFAGLAGNNDLKRQLTDFTARDLAGTEMWDAMRNSGLEVDFESSWINDMSETGQNILRGIGQGVGQMLPMVALTFATGGAAGVLGASAKTLGAVSKVTQAANLAALGMSAAGTSTERALNQEIYDENGNRKQVDLDRAYLYGLASGAVEVATEKLVGGVYSKVTGAGIADKLVNSLAKSTKFSKLVKFGLDTVGEGVEEMVSEAVDGSLKRIYDKNAETRPDVGAVFEAGVIGTLTSMVLGGAQTAVGKVSNTQTVQDSMIDLENINKRADSMSDNGKLTEEKATLLESERAKAIDTISKRYTRANDSARKKMLAVAPSIMDFINEDGSIKNMALAEGAAEVTKAQSGAMSGSLAVSRRAEIANTLKSQKVNIAKNITEEERKGAKWLSSALNLSGKDTGVKSKFVLVDDMAENTPAFQDGDITYVNRKILTDTIDKNGNITESRDEKLAKAFAHEISHFGEDTAEHAALSSFLDIVLKAEEKATKAVDKNQMSKREFIYKEVRDEYGFSEGLVDAIESGDADALKKYDIKEVMRARGEIQAKMGEYTIGNKEFIDKLIAEDRSLAKKVLNRIQNAIKKIKAYVKGDADTIASLKLLTTAEKLFSDSLAASGQKYLRERAKTNEKLTPQVQNSLNSTTNNDIRYSRESATSVMFLKSLNGMQLDALGLAFAKIDKPSKFFEGDDVGKRLASQMEQISTMDEGIQTKYADELATLIINNMVLTDVDKEYLNELVKRANVVSYYRHKLNVKPLMAEIESKYGKATANGILLQWQAPTGGAGMSVDTIVDELRGDGVIIKSDNEADIFFEMLDVIEEARKASQKVSNKRANELLNKKELTALQEELRDDIVTFMKEHGEDAEWKSNKSKIEKLMKQAESDAAAIIKLATLEAQLIEEKASHSYDKKIQEAQDNYKLQVLEDQLKLEGEILRNSEYQKNVNVAWYLADTLRKTERAKYKNSSEVYNGFEQTINKLGQIKYRGDLRKAGTRDIITTFGDTFYNVDNQILTGNLTKEEINSALADNSVAYVGYIDKNVLDSIQYLKDNSEYTLKKGKNAGEKRTKTTPLSLEEVQAVRIVLAGAKHLLETYDKVKVGEKYRVLSAEATNAVTMAEQAAQRFEHKVPGAEGTMTLINSILMPSAVINKMFGYRDENILSNLYTDILDGATKAKFAAIEMNQIIKNFFKDNRAYKRTLENDTIKIAGVDLKLSDAITLYMVSRQPEAWAGLTEGGYVVKDAKGYWVDCGKLTREQIANMAESFSKADLKFCDALRSLLDIAKKYMVDADIASKGYSMIDIIKRPNYFPIKRYSGDRATTVDDAPNLNVSVTSLGITKERVANAHRLEIHPILDVINSHTRDVGLYFGLGVPIKEFQRAYNCNVSTEKGRIKTLKNTINEKSWKMFDKYVSDLLKDIQGIPRGEQSIGSKFVGKIRANTIKFYLSVNLKTIISQIAGYPAIYTVLPVSSMMRGLTHSMGKKATRTMLANCPWAAVKYYEHGVVLAESLSDKLDAVTNFGTAGIQEMDLKLNVAIWNACQCEVERLHNGDAEYKFGTEKNMKEAAEIHARVGRETQGNSAKGEMSSMQRSNSEMVKTLAQLNSDGFKAVSNILSGVDRVLAYRSLEKQGVKISAENKSYAKKFTAKATSAFLVSTLVYVLMGELIRHILDKDEEEDKDGKERDWSKAFGKRYGSALINNIPIIKDIWSVVGEGYDLEFTSMSSINDLLNSVGGLTDLMGTLKSGEPYTANDIAAPLKKLVDALGMVTGIPTRNVYNYLYGFTKRFDASAAFKWESVFYTQKYSAELQKAIDEDDEDLQSTIVGLMLKEDGLTSTSAKVNEKLRELNAVGLAVLPKTVNESFSYDGEVYKMTQKQRKAFKAEYAKANEEVEALIRNQGFNSLTKEVQAKSIKWIYDYYYESATFAVVGDEPDTKKQLFGETMSIDKFAMTIAACNAVESSIDKNGNTITGSKKAAIKSLLNSLSLSQGERAIILAYLGYAVDDERIIKNYVSRIGLSKAQQNAILSFCGIAA